MGAPTDVLLCLGMQAAEWLQRELAGLERAFCMQLEAMVTASNLNAQAAQAGVQGAQHQMQAAFEAAVADRDRYPTFSLQLRLQ